jgi:hypothetical protein
VPSAKDEEEGGEVERGRKGARCSLEEEEEEEEEEEGGRDEGYLSSKS